MCGSTYHVRARGHKRIAPAWPSCYGPDVRPLRALPAALAAAALAAPATGCDCGPTFVDRSDSATAAPGTDANLPLDAGPGGPPTVTVGAWNIENFPMTAATVDDIAGLILGLGADILGLEEVADTAAFDMLVARLPGWNGVYALSGDGFTRVALVWKTDRVQVGNVQTLFEADGWAFPRPVLKSDVVVTEAGASGAFTFTFLVVHLKAQPDAESEDRRRMAVVALEQYVGSSLSLGVEDDFVIAGDWNDELTDPPVDNVFLPFIDSPEAYIFLDLANEQMGALPSYIPFGSYLDHMLVTAGALDEYGAGTIANVPLDATFPGYEVTVSDHRPVLATFLTPY